MLSASRSSSPSFRFLPSGERLTPFRRAARIRLASLSTMTSRALCSETRSCSLVRLFRRALQHGHTHTHTRCILSHAMLLVSCARAHTHGRSSSPTRIARLMLTRRAFYSMHPSTTAISRPIRTTPSSTGFPVTLPCPCFLFSCRPRRIAFPWSGERERGTRSFPTHSQSKRLQPLYCLCVGQVVRVGCRGLLPLCLFVLVVVFDYVLMR